MTKKQKWLVAAGLIATALAGTATGQIVGIQQVPVLDYNGFSDTSITNPSTSKGRVYFSTTDNLLHCLTSTGASCMPSGGGSGTVTSVSGTTNQISVATGTTTPVLSLPTTLIAPGSFAATSLGCGVLNTTTCVITGFGGTSGSGTLTWPAVASGNNPITTSLTLAAPVGNSSGPSYAFTGSGGGLWSLGSGETVLQSINNSIVFETASNTGQWDILNSGTTGEFKPENHQNIGDTTNTVGNIFTQAVSVSGAGAASSSPVLLNGTPFLAGTGTTNFPYLYLDFGASKPTTFSTGGELSGINAPSGFLGNFVSYHLNGGAAAFSVSQTGAITTLSTLSAVGVIQGSKLQTSTNCSSGASPAVCVAASSGSVAIPAGALQTLQVNTTAVTANSQILLTIDEGLGTKLSVTCNTTVATLTQPVVTARSAGSSFTIEEPATTSANPVCVSYLVLN